MRMNCKPDQAEHDRSRGFSTLEVLMVMFVSLVIAAFAIPGFNQVRRTLRISGDARDLNAAINQAKLMAAADFTRARVYIDLGFSNVNTFHVDVWNKAGNGGAGCWQVVGDFNNPCLTPGVSPVQYLSPGVSFGTGGVGAPPPNTQPNGIGQAPRCYNVHGNRFGQVATTACITFSSRGIPIDPNTALPNPNDAVYITDNTQVYAVSVGPTGLSQVWATSANGNGNWYHK
jgi:type II secretory pathway pseudopilin PulG